MSWFSSLRGSVLLPKLRCFFRDRDIFVHDGAAMKRVRLSSRAQIVTASAAAALSAISGVGLLQFAMGADQFSNGIATFASRHNEFRAMETKLATLQSKVVMIKTEAQQHVARLEARQAFLAALIKGEQNVGQLGAMLPARAAKVDPVAADVVALFNRVETQQAVLAGDIRRVADARYRTAAFAVTKMGISPIRLSASSMNGVGGPYEPMASDAKSVVAPKADPQFRALFNSWRQLDQLNKGIVAIPSQRPVNSTTLTSGFGVRSDPFRGGRAMHAGVDIPGAYATPIYATADAVVGRTGWIGGYGNLVELEHGKGIQTRYGHLSSIVVAPGTRVKRGQLIALMGSTGRSTGNHLHYEVRIDGRAVNPMPFLQGNDYLASMQSRSGSTAVGGPLASTPKK